nr:hypothetical protein [Rhodoferax sp.]
MSTNWLFDHVRRTSRNRIILAACIAAAAIALLAYNAKYLRDAYRGPAAVEASALAAAQSPQALPRQWVRVHVADLKDTGIEEISVRKKHGVERSRTVSAHYYVAPIDDRLLLVKVRGSERPSNDLVGEVLEVESGVAGTLFSGPNAARLKDMVLPLELDTHDYSDNARMLWWIAGLSLAGAAIYAWVAWTRSANPARHPAMKRAAQWGGIDEVAQLVKQEQAQAQAVGDWTLSDHYLLRNGTLAFDLHSVDALLWAYALVTKKKFYYVIPAGQSHALVLKWGDSNVKVEAKEQVVLSALQHIAEHQPWVAMGWTKETEQLFNQRGNGFASQIAKAKQQWARSRAPAAVSEPDHPPTEPMVLPR